MSLSTLPLDILFDVFVNLEDLGDVRALVTANRILYHTFQDHRAKVLQHVFRNQIIRKRESYLPKPQLERPSKDGIFTSKKVLGYVNTVVRRRMARTDELTLRTTAWSTFISFKSPFWVFGSFGRKLISLCENLSQAELVLSYSAALWSHIRLRQTFEYLTQVNHPVIDRDANKFALKLAKLYFFDFDRAQDAVRVIQECYSMNIKEHDFKLLSQLMEYSDKLADQDEMLSFFRGRAIVELAGLHTSKTHNSDLHSTYCLTRILCKLEKFEDAVCVFNNTLDTFVRYDLDPISLAGLARRFIASLLDAKHYDEAFTIRQQMLNLLSRTNKNTLSQYLGWAKQYIWELYSVDRADDAFVVEEQCWNYVRQRLALGQQRMYVFTGRNAAWSLCRSYEKRGQFDHAKRVRWEYESLAKPCMLRGSRVPWPGEDTHEVITETNECNGFSHYPEDMSARIAVRVSGS